MADFPGFLEYGVTADTENRLKIPGFPTPPPQWTSVSPQVGDQLTVLATFPAGAASSGTITATPTDYDGHVDPGLTRDFFEHIIVFSNRYALGVVLSEVQRTIEIYNAYRRTIQTWNSWTNNVDSGVSIPDWPSLPLNMPPQTGEVGTLTISPEGPPTISGTIDATFSALGTFVSLVSGQRAVLISIPPETPFIERLVFATNVIVAKIGTEQRIALRDVPRQIFDASYSLDGHDRRSLLVLLFDAQGRAAGLPLWHERTKTTAAISVSDTVVNVESTSYADWRADSIGVVWQDSETYEALEVDSFTGTTITFKSPFQNSFTAGAFVMPVRTVFPEAKVQGTRAILNLQNLNVRYSVIEPGIDLSDTSAWSTYRSKILLDEPNWADWELSETLEQNLDIVDGTVGLLDIYGNWTASRRGSRKTFFSNTRQRLWEVRQLLHALRGRAISFYLPTFYPDLEPIDGITDSSSVLRIKNIKYTTFVDERSPKGDLRVLLTDGTKIHRQITGSTEIDDDEEQLTVSSNWGVTATLDEIVSVSFVEKVRFDSDEILIEHLDALGLARISAPVKAVLD